MFISNMHLNVFSPLSKWMVFVFFFSPTDCQIIIKEHFIQVSMVHQLKHNCIIISKLNRHKIHLSLDNSQIVLGNRHKSTEKFVFIHTQERFLVNNYVWIFPTDLNKREIQNVLVVYSCLHLNLHTSRVNIMCCQYILSRAILSIQLWPFPL